MYLGSTSFAVWIQKQRHSISTDDSVIQFGLQETNQRGLTWATSSKSSCRFCRARALWRDFPTPVCLLRKASPWFSIQSITWMRQKQWGWLHSVSGWNHPQKAGSVHTDRHDDGLSPRELRMVKQTPLWCVCGGKSGHRRTACQMLL